MKLALALGLLVSGYYYYLHVTSDTALLMTNTITQQYAMAVDHPELILDTPPAR